MSNQIAVGVKVTDSENPKWGEGEVVETSDRKAVVRFTINGEVNDMTVFKKYLEVVGGTPKTVKKAAPKAEAKIKKVAKTAKPKAERKAREGENVVPLTRKDGKQSRSITAGAVLDHYKLIKDIKTAGGRPSFDIADKAATLLRGHTIQEQYRLVAGKLSEITGEKVSAASLEKKYGHLNPGQIRMNLGNKLRGALRNA
jgi:hypothetical protein